MKFCPVVPEICCGQVHGAQKERRRIRRIRIRIIIIIIIRNGAKTISPPNLFGRLKNNKKRSKNNKSLKQSFNNNSRITEEQCRYNKTCSTCRLDVEDEFHFSVIHVPVCP